MFSWIGAWRSLWGEILSEENAPLAYAALSHGVLVKAWGPVGQQVRLLMVKPGQGPG